MELTEIIAAILAGATAIFGGAWIKKAKGYIKDAGKYIKLVREGADVFVCIEEALQDDKITKEEIAKILKESKEVIATFKSLKEKTDG